MKFAIFNFFALQVIAWSLFFNIDKKNIGFANLTDTWQVVNVTQHDNHVPVRHPAFNQLTLGINGTFERLAHDGVEDNGKWSLQKDKSLLTLSSALGTEEFQIVQMPTAGDNFFVIKENADKSSGQKDFEYRLARL